MTKDKQSTRWIVILKRQTITMQEQERHLELDLLMQFLKENENAGLSEEVKNSNDEYN